MTLTKIEKAAKLMGYPEPDHIEGDTLIWESEQCLDSGLECTVTNIFNPYTNKADLVDVECALGIDVYWINNEFVHADSWVGEDLIGSTAMYKDHPDKFTARAHAVMSVVEQIYDRREG